MINSIKFEVIFRGEVDSTNEEAKRLIIEQKYPVEYNVICAKSQISGKGRAGRSWYSPKGNLYLSIILPKTSSLDDMCQLSFVTSLAVHKTLMKIFRKHNISKKVKLKWPNDILIDDKKVSGILIENFERVSKYIIIGIGINVQHFPNLENLSYHPTSLKEQGVNIENNLQITEMFLSYFQYYYKNWLVKGFLPIRQEWLKKCDGKGRMISVATQYNKVSGRFMDIDFSGAIRLQLSDGQIYTLNTGEVFFE